MWLFPLSFAALLVCTLVGFRQRLSQRRVQSYLEQLEQALALMLRGQSPELPALPAPWSRIVEQLQSIATFLAVMRQSMDDRVALLEENNLALETQKKALQESRNALQESMLALEHYHNVQDKFRGLLEMDAILQQAMELLVQELSPRQAFFLKYDPEQRGFQVCSPVGTALQAGPLPARDDAEALTRLFDTSEKTVLELDPLPLYGLSFSSGLLARIMIDGELWGLIALLDKEARQGVTRFGDQDQLILANLTSILQKDLKSAHLFELATVDSLSRLYVRRYFERRVENEIKRSQRAEHVFCLLMMDIDHFKRFNDTYGHLVGDEVIREVAALIRQQIRGNDLAGRYGGEEIVVLMPETSQEAALVAAERIRSAIEALQIPALVGTKAAPHVTISIGVAQYPQHGDTIPTLLEFADQGLYQAKQNGRNQVRLFATPIT
jgi:diguanylate cyclase (GGDEF)-like protein